MMHIQLSEIADVFNGKTPSKSEQRDSGLSILKIKDTDIDNRFLGFESFVENEFYEKNKGKVLREGDTLFLNAAHNASHVCSKNYYVPKILEGVIPTGEWLVVRSNDERVDKQYINYYLTSPTGLFYIKNLVKGIHLYPKDVSRLEVPLPSPETQKKIAEILDKADALRQQDKKIIEKYDQLTQSVFLDMFGDPVSNLKGWNTKLFGELGKLMSGGTPSRSNPDFFNGTIPWVTTFALGGKIIDENDAVEFITKEAVERSATKLIPKGSIMIGTRVGIGKASILGCDMCSNQDIVSVVNLDQLIDKSFLIEIFSYFEKFFENQKRGATIQGITSQTIKQLKIIIPPIDLQNRFAEIVKKIEKQKQLAQKSLEKSEQLFQSLLQRAFKGELV